MDIERHYILCGIYYSCVIMMGKCDNCGMENVEVMSIRKQDSQEQMNLCNQCRPADGAYAY